MKKVLLHICCGPCGVFPVEQLQGEGLELMGYYANPNIHPYTEYQQRRQSVEMLAGRYGLKMLYEPSYCPEEYFREVSFRESRRCYYCYALRLEAAARYARKGRFDAFTSTLLVSRYQKHEMIWELGESIGERYSVPFLYRDFRPGFDAGRQKAREMGFYMQKYCGCIYSEVERFAPKVKKS